MERRAFLAWSAAAGASAVAGPAAFLRWQEIAPTLRHPGRAEGHFLRAGAPLPPPSEVLETDIVILGSGVAAVSAAWKLSRGGHKNALMIDGPEPFGNAAGGRFGDLAYPTGAHYLPLATPESAHVREILADLGLIGGDPQAEAPTYDERCVLHGPAERVLHAGRWQEGMLPGEGLAPLELAEQERFFAEMARIGALRGADGRRFFTLPVQLGSSDPAWDHLDALTFKQWLDRNGYRAPSVHWYANYGCRDDYGMSYDGVSAWAGLHYFCCRAGARAANAAEGALLTWPGGLSELVGAMARRSGVARRTGSAASLRRVDGGVEVLCFALEGGVARSWLVRARKAICAMPLQVAARVVESIGDYGFDPARHMPVYPPWMVANFLMKDFPSELPEAPLSWDNVVYDGARSGLEAAQGLGYVVSTHQDIRVRPPEKTVFSAYVALTGRSPGEARKWLAGASADELLALAAADLKAAYGINFAPCVERVEITLRGHAMAAPLPGFRGNAGLAALREADGAVLFAHADLTGFSLFEEAAWWGCRAAERALA
ncbi:NAD(P)-binding protein [Massilia glaciei]|uniref:Amine oxidase n=1 Tax=Massilia glaciei TaxID=1524097 RepID=A0A2U2HEK5_9BURK|nr:NAD(P)-binding protein [Massilia glaciei]PWF42073.1 amine oxidase [Massilia glaciei]